MKVKTLSVKDGQKVNIGDYPNFHKSGSVAGMRKMYYSKDALLVRCGSYIYNVSRNPSIYDRAH